LSILAKKIISIFAAMAFDKHLDYDQDESTNRGNRKEKECEKRLFITSYPRLTVASLKNAI
jgi:hypothetical protein